MGNFINLKDSQFISIEKREKRREFKEVAQIDGNFYCLPINSGRNIFRWHDHNEYTLRDDNSCLRNNDKESLHKMTKKKKEQKQKERREVQNQSL